MPNVSAAQEDDVIEANRALALRYAELRLAGWPEEQLSTIFADDSITHTWALGDGLDATYDRGFMTANAPFDMQDCQAWASVSFALLSCYATGTFGENFGDLTANNAD